MMEQASTARAFLRRLHPWLGRAVHTRWTTSRAAYRREAEALLLALTHHEGRIPVDLALRLEGFLGQLYREWFPRTWRPNPTYAEVIRDFRWWLGLAETWGQPPPRAGTTRRRPRRAPEPLAQQPEQLLRMLALPRECTRSRFLASWRRFVKANHPDLNPDQTPEERRRFAEAVALRRR
jgi:hypothetical protein